MNANSYLDKEPETEPPDDRYFNPEDIQRWLDEDPYYQKWLEQLEAEREENDNSTTETPISKRAGSL